MKNWTLLRTVCLAASLVACAGGQKRAPAAAPAAPSPQLEKWSVSPVEAYGRLQVCGTKICGKGGKPVQLRGMSLFWSNSGWTGAKYYDASVVNTLADTWHATVIRAAVGVQQQGGYLAASTANKARAKVVVDAAIAKGMYVIVDWHSHALLEEDAIAFFKEMATAYAASPNLIWEPFNEPVKQSWSSQLKPYHEKIIATIRAAGSQNLVVVGSPTWSQDVDVAAADPITTDKNVAYTLHFYAGTHRQWLRDKADRALQRGVALFVTEWGTCDASGNGGFDPASSKLWTDWMDANVISSANWALNDKEETASALGRSARIAGPWTDAQLTESGRWAKAYIQAGYR
ncbi:MAG TPA: glycoside hydrolase family 5 protein [Anaeromyxobacter sp.]|nr:glycoside hydrolase family 5 protein [Anaeromyxobacter sp.]